MHHHAMQRKQQLHPKLDKVAILGHKYKNTISFLEVFKLFRGKIMLTRHAHAVIEVEIITRAVRNLKTF